MIKYNILFFVVGILAISCAKKQPEPEKKAEAVSVSAPIEEAKLIKILADVHIAESIINMQIPERRDSCAKNLYSRVFKKYNVTKSDFDKSFSTYSAVPLAAQAIYEKVSNELSMLEAKYRNEPVRAPAPSAPPPAIAAPRSPLER